MDECLHTSVRRTSKTLTLGMVGYYQDRIGICNNCGQHIRQFWVDGDEDRRGRWSKWAVPTFVIEEEQELTWNEVDSSTT